MEEEERAAAGNIYGPYIHKGVRITVNAREIFLTRCQQWINVSLTMSRQETVGKLHIRDCIECFFGSPPI